MPKFDKKITDSEIVGFVEASEVDTVFFKRIYPPQYDRNYRSFFGGLPQMPEELKWPTEKIVVDWEKPKLFSLPYLQNSLARIIKFKRPRRKLEAVHKDVPCTFLAQIDCSELPRHGHLKALPSKGILYFFFSSATSDLQLSEKPGKGGKVIYWDGNTDCLEEKKEPENLGPVYGSSSWYHFGWMEAIVNEQYGYPKTFSKWGITPFTAKTYSAEHLLFEKHPDAKFKWPENDVEIRKAKQDIWSRLNNIQREKLAISLEQAFPPSIERNYFVIPDDQLSKWQPENGFPCAWISLEIFAGELLKKISEDLKWNRLTKSEELDSFIKDLANLVKQSRERGRFSRVSDDDVESFWRWYKKCRAEASEEYSKDPRHWVHLEKALAEAYRVGPRLCISHSEEAFKLVPDSYIEDQRWQHHVRISGHGGSVIQHKMMDAEIDEHLGPDYVLLMQFDSDEGIDWMWCDVGVAQYWIKKTDLAALNFDNVIIKTFGG